MQNRTDRYKLVVLAAFILGVFSIVLFKFVLKLENIDFLAYIFFAVGVAVMVYGIYVFDLEKKQKVMNISRIVGNEGKDAYNYGQVGIIILENNKVSWQSDFLNDRGFSLQGQKINKAINDTDALVIGKREKIVYEKDDRKYEFYKPKGSNTIFVKDITDIVALQQAHEKEMVVLGLLNIDNYEEATQNGVERITAAVNNLITQRAIDWLYTKGAVIRKLRNDRYLIIVSYEDFKNIQETQFTILQEVEKEAANNDIAVTTSMVFSYGNESYIQADNNINSLLDLVLSRGGNQVAVKEDGKDVRFYGTSSEISGKSSKVKARFVAKQIKQMVDAASEVIVVPHADADLDCLGSSLALSRIISKYQKRSYILMNDIPLESKTEEILEMYMDELMEDHIFINHSEALSMLDDKTLVIMVDHQDLSLTADADLIKKCKNIAVIDHHRRKSETNIETRFNYSEAAASSTVEMITELIEYQPTHVGLSDIEATIMYAGILVDTEKLQSRCSARTFEVCALLKKYGADTSEANGWLQETLDDFMTRKNLIKNMEINNGIVISYADDNSDFLNRTQLAQAANYLVSIKEVDAAFVIGKTSVNGYAVSARSNGEVNVQLIMEEMGGGGHFSAAGCQRNNTSMSALKEEILANIDKYQQKGREDEDNSVS